MNHLLPKLGDPDWIDGPPNNTGLWIVEDESGNRLVWQVELDIDEEAAVPHFVFVGKSAQWRDPHHPFPVERSFGPCPLPSGERILCSPAVLEWANVGLTWSGKEDDGSCTSCTHMRNEDICDSSCLETHSEGTW